MLTQLLDRLPGLRLDPDAEPPAHLRRDLPRARAACPSSGTDGDPWRATFSASELEPCSFDPLTGFMRDGCCDSHGEDVGVHLVCVRDDRRVPRLLGRAQGNDLVTPVPEYGFAGLKAGRPVVPVRAPLAGGVRGRRRAAACTSPRPTPGPSNGARSRRSGPTPPTRDGLELPAVH